MSTKGVVFNLLRYTIDDGPGIRSTVFLKGCPLHCPWCANPESQKVYPEISCRKATCIRCGRCESSCPQKAITIGEKRAEINRSKCQRCQNCVKACFTGSMDVMGKEMSVEEVMKVVRRDIDFYNESGGGVTVSGGEPLMQPEFLKELLLQLKQEGYHTCVDTTGYCTTDILAEVMPYADLFYFDIKHMDSEKHLEVTGVPNEPILRNLRLLAENKKQVCIRVPYIPGFNDDDNNMDAMGLFVSEVLPGNEVHLLPYHRYGVGKYEMLDMKYQLDDLKSPEDSQLQHSKKILDKYGLNCVIHTK